MKLSDHQIDQVRNRFGVDPVPDDHPSVPDLKETFGDHTFYIDSTGLHIWETAETAGDGTQFINALRVASWVNEEQNSLSTHNPESTGINVKLTPIEPIP